MITGSYRERRLWGKKGKKNRAFIDVRAATGEVTEEFIGVGE